MRCRHKAKAFLLKGMKSAYCISINNCESGPLTIAGSRVERAKRRQRGLGWALLDCRRPFSIRMMSESMRAPLANADSMRYGEGGVVDCVPMIEGASVNPRGALTMVLVHATNHDWKKARERNEACSTSVFLGFLPCACFNSANDLGVWCKAFFIVFLK